MQLLIIYDRDGETVVYSTLYSERDVKAGIFECVCHHGRDVGARRVVAAQFAAAG